jgi:hypothetical protein
MAKIPLEKFSSPHASFLPPEIPILPMRKSSENIFQSFTHGQNWNFGGGEEKPSYPYSTYISDTAPKTLAGRV